MSALAAASSSHSGSGVSTLLFLVPLVLLAYMFWSYRKKQRGHQRSQASLIVGEEVCTTSGLFGTLVSLDDSIAELEVSPGVRLRFDRRAVVPPKSIAAGRRGAAGERDAAAVKAAADDSVPSSDAKA